MAEHPMAAALARAEAELDERKRLQRIKDAGPLLLAALKCLEEEMSDYMRINNLGDPGKKHNIRLARAAIAKATGT
jgi:hypothetical protein